MLVERHFRGGVSAFNAQPAVIYERFVVSADGAHRFFVSELSLPRRVNAHVSRNKRNFSAAFGDKPFGGEPAYLTVVYHHVRSLRGAGLAVDDYYRYVLVKRRLERAFVG